MKSKGFFKLGAVRTHGVKPVTSRVTHSGTRPTPSPRHFYGWMEAAERLPLSPVSTV